jgi:Fe-S cluster biosynthesis and repair protein YggX
MSRVVYCQKLKRELPAMPYQPFADELGKRIYSEISYEAWKLWLEHSKMIVNEERLELNSEHAHQVLKAHCEEYFFGDGDGSARPANYKPPT